MNGRVLFRCVRAVKLRQFSSSAVLWEQKPCPLVVILPWLGATDKGITKYATLHKENNCDVVVHKTKLQDFLWPKTGLKNSEKFLKKISMEFDDRPVIIHSFSIGCYFYALMLIHMNTQENEFEKLKQQIRGQIFDSPVIGSLHEMAVGVSKMVMKNQFLQSLTRRLCLGYFSITKPFTVKIYDQSLFHLSKHPIRSKSLFISSRNDPMFQEKALLEMVDSLKSIGCDVTMKIWNESEHAQHLRMHKDEYETILTQFHSAIKY